MVQLNNKLPSQRQLRVAEEIRQTLALFFANTELYYPSLVGKLITVHEVKISADLKIATAFVQISPEKLPNKDFKDTFVDIASNCRRLLATQLKLRYAPELRFRQDELVEEVTKLESLLKNISSEG
jgi:ribosome-binding factor A